MNQRSHVIAAGTLLASVLAAIPGLSCAQCGPYLVPSGGVSGVRGYVAATLWWDQDGAGPQPGVLVVGGAFDLAGTVAVSNLATWDPATGIWSSLGGGTVGSVQTLARLPNGDLLVGGQFLQAGNLITDSIASWNGINWSRFGAGIQGVVLDTAVLPNGDLCAGGIFLRAGGQPCPSLARWNGVAWSPLGAAPNHNVYALEVLPNGDLVAGGEFTQVGTTPTPYVARWNGTTWSALGPGVGGAVLALTNWGAGSLAVAGEFTYAGSSTANHVALWNGSAWSPLGSGVSHHVLTLHASANGQLLLGGTFATAGSVASCGITAWNGQQFTSLSNTTQWVQSITTLPNQDIIAGGSSRSMFGIGACGVARWNGTNWNRLHAGTNADVRVARSLANGNVVVGGSFDCLGGVTAHHIALRNGSTWSPLGSGTDDAVTAVVERANGDLVVGGEFTSAGGNLANRVAVWTGNGWQTMGTGINGTVGCLLETTSAGLLATAAVIVGGQPGHGVLRWNGTSWQPLGSGVLNAVSLVEMPNGDLLVSQAGSSQLRRWDGTNWVNFAAPTPMTLGSLLVTRTGTLYATGGGYLLGFPFGAVASWNGSVWLLLPPVMGNVASIAELPDQSILVGTYASGAITNPAAVLRWDGFSWQPFGDPLAGSGGPNGAFALLPGSDGSVLVGGRFDRVGAVPSVGLAELAAGCPAGAIGSGPGCSGSSGPVELVAQVLPFLGADYVARLTGAPTTSLAVSVRGLGPTATPLSSLLPQGVAGCLLGASPDVLDLFVPGIGPVQTGFHVPYLTALIGQSLWHQVVVVEIGSTGSLSAVTSSGTLRLTIGAL